jgi:CRP-like cAMP-binding protein
MATHIINNAQKLTPAIETFCDFPPSLINALEQEAITTTYPTGAVLFAEGQAPRGVFIVRRGRVKLSICGSDGRTLILRIVEAGCPLGVAAVVSGRPYEATAETQEPCEVSFLRQCDLLRLMRLHGELALWVTQHISQDYAGTCREIRDLILPEPGEDGFDSRRDRTDDWNFARDRQPAFRRLQEATSHPAKRLHACNPQPGCFGISHHSIEETDRWAGSPPPALALPKSFSSCCTDHSKIALSDAAVNSKPASGSAEIETLPTFSCSGV